VMPEAFAIWKVYPDQYDPDIFPGRGGVLYETGPSPTMIAFDGFGNAFASLDRMDKVFRVGIDGSAGHVQLPSVRLDNGDVWDFSNGNGPGAVSGPDGSVWLANLGAPKPWVVRFHPGSKEPEIVKLNTNSGFDDDRRIIHMAFSVRGGVSGRSNVLYALTSSLLYPKADEAIIINEFDKNWSAFKPDGEVGFDEVKLTRDNSAAHRITVAENLQPRSLLVTGLSTGTIFQMSGDRI